MKSRRLDVEVDVGKLSSLMIQAALVVMRLKPEDCILIGDRLETNIKMGRDAGVATGVVLTGVTVFLLGRQFHPCYFQPV